VSEDEEEDWFERAMREADDDEEDAPRATAEESEETAQAEAPDADSARNEGATTDGDEPTRAAESDEDDPFGGIATGDDAGVSDEEADPFGGVTADEESTFGADPDEPGEPSGGSQPEEGSFGSSQQDPFGRGERDPFGGEDVGEFGSGTESDPFGGADADPFGGGEAFGGGSDFNEAEFESDIDRIDVGIDGLDEMVLGGIPTRSLMVTIGAAGTGKTTFALQFLTEALENDQKAVYVTLEESREAILSTAEEKGWPFRKWNEEGELAIVSMDPIEMANSLSSIRNDISRLVEEFDADRLVLDSVSLLEMMYDHPAQRRSEVFDFARSLKRAGVTTMLTSEASSEDSYTSRYGIIEYLVDAVFILQYVRPSDFRETRLAVEIQKIRDANHSRETKPYEITNDGISVYRQANIF
jgi:KaiC domain protein